MVDVQHLAVLAGLAFCSNLIYGLTSFGAGIVFQCGWHMAELARLVEGGMNKGTSNLAAFMFITRALQAFHLRKHVAPKLGMLMVGMGLPFLFIGTAVAYSIPTGSLQVTIGVVLLGIMVAQFASEGSSHEPPALEFGGADGKANGVHVTAVGVAAACSGCLMGLCGIPGPPLMILLAFFISVELTAWRATAAVVQWVLGSVQVVLLAYLGAVKGGVDDLTEVGVMVVGGMCGLSAGNLLSKHVNAASFRKAMVVLIAMSSASLITSQAAAEVQLWTTVAFAVLSVGYSLRQHMFEHYVSAEQPYAAVAQTASADECSAAELESGEKAVLLDDGDAGPSPAGLSEEEYLASLPNPNEGGAPRGCEDSPLEGGNPFLEVPCPDAPCTVEAPRGVAADRAETNGAIRNFSEGSAAGDPLEGCLLAGTSEGSDKGDPDGGVDL